MTLGWARVVPSGRAIFRFIPPVGVLCAMLTLTAPVCRADGGYPPFRVMSGGEHMDASMDLAPATQRARRQPAPSPVQPAGDLARRVLLAGSCQKRTQHRRAIIARERPEVALEPRAPHGGGDRQDQDHSRGAKQ